MNHGRIQDFSGTVAAGGTSQQVLGVNEARKYLLIQNPGNATEALYVNFDTAASTTAKNSIELSAGGSISFSENFVPINAVNVTAATSAHAFICKEGR